MSRTLIIGSAGQLGSELLCAFPPGEAFGADLEAADFQLDITNYNALRSCITEVQPSCVILTAALHEPAFCEAHPQLAYQINALSCLETAVLCRHVGARLIYISTDYVYGGYSFSPARPFQEIDPVRPVNVYGKSKTAGERYVIENCSDYLIIRTASLYGQNPCRGKKGRNFVETMLARAREGSPVHVVTDEMCSPTCARDLAEQISILATAAPSGIYHAVSKGFCSWYDFAREIFFQFKIDADLLPVQRMNFQDAFRRPAYSLLDRSKLARSGLDCMPDWQDGLKKYAAARSLEI